MEVKINYKLKRCYYNIKHDYNNIHKLLSLRGNTPKVSTSILTSGNLISILFM